MEGRGGAQEGKKTNVEFIHKLKAPRGHMSRHCPLCPFQLPLCSMQTQSAQWNWNATGLCWVQNKSKSFASENYEGEGEVGKTG